MKNWQVALSMTSGQRTHGDGSPPVLQPVVGLVADGRACFLFDELRVVAAGQKTLARVDLVDDRLLVVAAFHVGEKVVDRLGGLLGIQLHRDVSQPGLDQHDGVFEVDGGLRGRRNVISAGGRACATRTGNGGRGRGFLIARAIAARHGR